MTIDRPGGPQHMTISVRRINGRVLHYQVHLDKVLKGEGRMTLVEEDKAWVDITWPAGKPEHARALLYVKRQ